MTGWQVNKVIHDEIKTEMTDQVPILCTKS